MTAEQKKAAPVLSVNHVVKAFGAKRAVDDVTLDVMPGDIFGFVGHNGAGKTTLIRAIVGVTDFDEGDIRIAGQSVKTDALACQTPDRLRARQPRYLRVPHGHPVPQLPFGHLRGARRRARTPHPGVRGPG